MLLRRVIGDALRARRQAQHRTLREVSGAANVSLGYLSEIERGQKEASSELLASICDALGAQLSDVLREVSNTFALAEQVSEAMSPAVRGSRTLVPAAAPAGGVRVDLGAARIGRLELGPLDIDPQDPAGTDLVPAIPLDIPPDRERSAAAPVPTDRTPAPAEQSAAAELINIPAPTESIEEFIDDLGGVVTVTVHHDAPLKTTLRAVRNVRSLAGRERDVARV